MGRPTFALKSNVAPKDQVITEAPMQSMASDQSWFPWRIQSRNISARSRNYSPCTCRPATRSQLRRFCAGFPVHKPLDMYCMTVHTRTSVSLFHITRVVRNRRQCP
jgi:hypothetical protein